MDIDSDIKLTTDLSIKIYSTIIEDKKLIPFIPDALMRVYVYMTNKNDWSLQKIIEESEKGIKHYFEHYKALERQNEKLGVVKDVG